MITKQLPHEPVTSLFERIVQPDTPRLVVMYKREGDREGFQWGVVGNIPLISIVGAVCRAQARLMSGNNPPDRCPQPALVIAWYEDRFYYFSDPAIPVEAMVGMLETLKQPLVATNLARQAANQQVILGPDGVPIRH